MRKNVYTSLNRQGRRNIARLMRRDESGHGGGVGSTQSPAPNNMGGNSPDSSGGGTGEQNNNGQSFDYTGFWNDQEQQQQQEQNPQPQVPANPQQQPQQPQGFGAQLASEIQGLSFGQLFNNEIADEIADGKLDGVNQSFNTMGQQIVKQSVVLTAKLMQEFSRNQTSMMREMIQEALGNRDNTSTLMESFPSMKDPAMAPIINGVFQQSLKHSKGDRQKAIEMTRDMLKYMGKTATADFGIETPPGSREDSYVSDGSRSLVDELLGRSG